MSGKLMTALGVVLSVSAVDAMDSQLMSSNDLTSNSQMQNLAKVAEEKNLDDNDRVQGLILSLKEMHKKLMEEIPESLAKHSIINGRVYGLLNSIEELEGVLRFFYTKVDGQSLFDANNKERVDRFELIDEIRRINQMVYDASINPTLGDISEEEAANEKYIEQLRELVHQDIHAVLAPFSAGDKIDKISTDRVCDLLAQLRCSDLPTSVKLTNWNLQEVPNSVKKMGYILILSQEPNPNYLMKTEVCRDFGFRVVDGEMYKL